MNLRKMARGRQCMVRIPFVCSCNPETVVLAHLPGGGMSRKRHDMHGAWACYACHDALDGRVRSEFSRAELRMMHMEAVIRTQEALIEEGVLC